MDRRSHLRHVACAALAALATFSFAAEQVVISSPTEDATLYEDDADGNSGGWKGIAAGRTLGSSPRRALIRFGDLSALPEEAIVTGVELRLFLVLAGSRGPEATDLSLHRLTESWVEGNGLGQLPGQQGGGSGGEVVAGAVTWDSREHDTLAWTTPGGAFEAQASAVATVGNSTGTDFVWSAPAMVADVQAWLDGTAANNGWILLEGPEPGSGRLFNSSEVDPENDGPRPRLVIDYVTERTPEFWMVQ